MASLSARMAAALQACADDLAAELNDRYRHRETYETERQKYNNEMEVVTRARALLLEWQNQGGQ